MKLKEKVKLLSANLVAIVNNGDVREKIEKEEALLRLAAVLREYHQYKDLTTAQIKNIYHAVVLGYRPEFGIKYSPDTLDVISRGCIIDDIDRVLKGGVKHE